MHTGRHDEVNSTLHYLSERHLKFLIICSFSSTWHRTRWENTPHHAAPQYVQPRLCCSAMPVQCRPALLCPGRVSMPFTCVKRHVERQAAQVAQRHDGRFLLSAVSHVESAMTRRPGQPGADLCVPQSWQQSLLRSDKRAHGSRGLCPWLIMQCQFFFTSNRSVSTTSLIQHLFP